MPKKKSREKSGSASGGEEEKEVKLDLGKISFSFGGLFKGLGNLIDMASELQEKAGKMQKEGKFTIPVGGKKVEGVYGFSVRTMADGKPEFRTFGTKIKETPKGPVVSEEREPLVDIFDEKDYIRIVAEVPGVSEDEIKVELQGDIININTAGEKKYSKEILIKSPVKPESMTKVFKNGILEIRFDKK